ncbi:MAG: GTPase Era [bacterium]
MENFKSGYVSLIGKPNVGKSTLFNTLLKEKISIVTSKPQTTRNSILGILSGENYQIIFTDTPGILIPEYLLQKIMLKSISKSVNNTDVIVLLMDPFSSFDLELKTIKKIKKEIPVLLAINKIDLIKKEKLLPLIDISQQSYDFKEIIPISAMKNEGIDVLLKSVIEYLPFSPPFYDPEQLTIDPERFFVAEIIREEIFNYFKEEIPYSTGVKIEEFQEKENNNYIKAIIWVERISQKGILIGKNGDALKQIGILSRKQIENFLEKKVYLELWVKVKKNWRKDKQMLKQLGYGE